MNVNPESLLGYSNVVYIVGAIITLIGTFGIVYYSNAASKIKESQLKQYQKEADLKIAAANLRAAEAYQKGEEAQSGASGANAEAARAKAQSVLAQAEAEKAKAEASEANAKAEQFRLDIAKARESAAKAEARAAEANLELSKLKMPRSLTAEQRQRITAKLHPFAGQEFCFALNPNAESISLMNVFESMLVSAGWVKTASLIGDVEVAGAGVSYGEGIELHIAPADLPSLRAVVTVFKDALSNEGLPTIVHTNPQMVGKRPKVINIVIGAKPI